MAVQKLREDREGNENEKANGNVNENGIKHGDMRDGVEDEDEERKDLIVR